MRSTNISHTYIIHKRGRLEGKRLLVFLLRKMGKREHSQNKKKWGLQRTAGDTTMGALIQAWISDEEFKMLEEMEQYFEELQDRDFGGKAYLNNY